MRPGLYCGLAAFVLSGVLAAVLGTPAIAEPNTAAPFDLVVAPGGPDNARNSEAAMIPLRDRRLLLAWSDFYTSSDGGDFGPARISGRISGDGGRTWGDEFTVVENEGKCNILLVNFIRLKSGKIALLYNVCNSETDLRIVMRTSGDEGRTFGDRRELTGEGRYVGLTNDRCVRLQTGRILLPAWEKGNSFCMISDDDGATWREGRRARPAAGGCGEPACAELRDGRVMMLMRTELEGQYISLSSDGGETWNEPTPTQLRGTSAPVCITRIPKTGDLLAIWNCNTGVDRRNPLTSAISRNEGRTWGHYRNLEDAPGGAWGYAAVTWVDDVALVTYIAYEDHGSLKLKGLPVGWFYE